MVADSLAIALAEKYVPHGAAVLDPFCGSGRLLVAAAKQAELCVGSDLNPLAYLLTRSKFAHPRHRVVSSVLSAIPDARHNSRTVAARLRGKRTVEWFSRDVLVEVQQITDWLNSLDLNYDERLLIGACLSAAARDASYISKGGWKLHRLRPEDRKVVSAWDCFERRLQYCFEELTEAERPNAKGRVFLADARSPLVRPGCMPLKGPFDVVITSPPYGDSDSTVQYGAASELSLDLATRLRGLGKLYARGCTIDSSCLGGGPLAREIRADYSLRSYWAGSTKSPTAKSVCAFLNDFKEACETSAERLKPSGTFVLVLGRRTVGGHRLHLDKFADASLRDVGLRYVDSFSRTIRNKRIPQRVNRFARAESKTMQARGSILTMSEEQVLVFKRT